jgi:nitrite reductase/ring-hydroxylating ferredoxin subunit/Fe-S cluster biogenesis protein NfuA
VEPEDRLPSEVAAAVERLDALVKRFEEHPDPAVQDRVFELLWCVDALHRAGLRQLNELLKVAGLQQRALDDPEVRLLFELYDLWEGGDQARAEAVVQSLRRSLEAVGADLELVEASAETVRVRLSPPAAGCDSSVAGLHGSVEQRLRDGLPGVRHVEVEDAAAASGTFVPLGRLRLPRWEPVVSLDELPIGGLHAAELGGERVLLARLGSDEVYAYRNACPASPFPLDGGVVSDGTLQCPWHGCRFELRGGRRQDASAPGLGVLPVRVEAGVVHVLLAVGAAA